MRKCNRTMRLEHLLVTTRNSSEDDIANVNFLYIVHAVTHYRCNRLVHKFRHRSTRLCVRTQVYQIQ